jgi:hypothetical protein
MNVTVVLVIGGAVGVLDGVGIFFCRDEPLKTEIFVAAILKGILVALLTGLSLMRLSAWWQGAPMRTALWPCIRSDDFSRQRRIQIDGRSVRCALRRNPRNSDGAVAC